MWWSRKKAEKDFLIKARLKRGETLHIFYNHDREGRDLQIEGWGEIRLAIRSSREIKAELIPKQKARAADESRDQASPLRR